MTTRKVSIQKTNMRDSPSGDIFVSGSVTLTNVSRNRRRDADIRQTTNVYGPMSFLKERNRMSLADHRGAVWAWRELHRAVQADIDAGRRQGAKVRWPHAHPKVTMSWFTCRLLRRATKEKAS